MRQHLEKLNMFHAVALNGSFLKASKVIGLSQPALTKSIQQLEAVVEKKLLIRHRRGITLTEAGVVLFTYCEKLFFELSDLEVRMNSPKALSGILRIGSYETLGVSYWPKVLKKIQLALPDLQIKISTDNPDTIWNRLDEGLIDLIVDAEPPMREMYFSKVLFHDKFGIYAKPKFKLQDKKLPFTYVKRAMDHEGKTIADHLRSHKIEHELSYDFDSFISCKAVAIEGLALAVLPNSVASDDVKKGKLDEFSIRGKNLSFGDHRICVTSLEARRSDERIVGVMKNLRSALTTST